MITVLFSSPRPHGNTAALLDVFLESIHQSGETVQFFDLYGMNILGCRACLACQEVMEGFGCPIEDDMPQIFDALLQSDLILLASPIYSWYVPSPMKAALDRLVYGMNKYYGPIKGHSLWRGKALALLISCGYPPEKGADLFEEGMRRYARHSGLSYKGMLAEHDKGYAQNFMDEEKRERVKSFASKLTSCLNSEIASFTLDD